MPDARWNHEDRPGIQPRGDWAGVEKERDLDASLKNMEQLLALRVPLPRTSLSDRCAAEPPEPEAVWSLRSQHPKRHVAGCPTRRLLADGFEPNRFHVHWLSFLASAAERLRWAAA
jgi:hypothetical protein